MTDLNAKQKVSVRIIRLENELELLQEEWNNDEIEYIEYDSDRQQLESKIDALKQEVM